MSDLLKNAGNTLAIGALLLCLISAAVRITGTHYLFGFELMTVFIGGGTLLILACLAKLQQLLEQAK